MATVLRFGVKQGQSSIHVVEDGTFFKSSVRWLQELTDIELMHRIWPNRTHEHVIQSYQPKIVGFYNALKLMRK